MKTAVQDTSIESFFGIQSKLNKREKELFEVLEVVYPISDRELARQLNWEIGSVNGRRNALVEKGMVEEDSRVISPITGKRVILWKPKKEIVQQPLF